MDDLITVIEKFKYSLQNTECIRRLIANQERIYHHQVLMDLIFKYHDTKDDDLRKKIYQYSEFIEYKKSENELNFLILEINQKLRKITKLGDSYESH